MNFKLKVRWTNYSENHFIFQSWFLFKLLPQRPLRWNIPAIVNRLRSCNELISLCLTPDSWFDEIALCAPFSSLCTAWLSFILVCTLKSSEFSYKRSFWCRALVGTMVCSRVVGEEICLVGFSTLLLLASTKPKFYDLLWDVYLFEFSSLQRGLPVAPLGVSYCVNLRWLFFDRLLASVFEVWSVIMTFAVLSAWDDPSVCYFNPT